MPKLLVQFDQQRNLVFRLPDGETVIGRGEEANLILPNVSVSRRHARIVVRGGAAVLEDLESQNGTLVNTVPATRQPLKSKDVIKLGRFTLVFLGDGSDDRFFDGRCVDYLAPYTPGGPVVQGVDETFVMSKESLKAFAAKPPLSETGRIVSERDRRRFWFPEDRTLTFGAGAMVDTPAWYVFGTAAEIRWDGTCHSVWKRSFWVPLSVNGQSVTARPLKVGDRIVIANSRFRYESEG
ncbi:MAG: FHA domain-containing protein [Pseudomonadota bacterium]|nr:FHA domain-containing protein [Pseudomonadota bacterium]